MNKHTHTTYVEKNHLQTERVKNVLAIQITLQTNKWRHLAASTLANFLFRFLQNKFSIQVLESNDDCGYEWPHNCTLANNTSPITIISFSRNSRRKNITKVCCSNKKIKRKSSKGYGVKIMISNKFE